MSRTEAIIVCSSTRVDLCNLRELSIISCIRRNQQICNQQDANLVRQPVQPVQPLPSRLLFPPSFVYVDLSGSEHPRRENALTGLTDSMNGGCHITPLLMHRPVTVERTSGDKESMSRCEDAWNAQMQPSKKRN